MISIGGGFELGDKLVVNTELLILTDDYGDTYHVLLPRIDYVSKRNRFGLTPTYVPDGDPSVVLFFTFAHSFGKY